MSLLEKLIGSMIAAYRKSESKMATCIDFHDGTLRRETNALTDCFDKKINGIRICCAAQ